MPTNYTVQPGDCLDSIAFAHGLFPDTVWDDGANAALKAGRADRNVLLPGDVVVIPDLRPKEHPAATDQLHTFRRKGVPKLFSVQIKLPSGKPFKNQPFELVVDDGPPRTGETDGDGWVKQYIAPDAREAVLTVAGMTQTFDLGWLDPVTEPTGVQGRLRALKYFAGEVDGNIGDDTVAAIKAFQAWRDLEPTGEVTDELRKLLVEEAGA